jgi:hypothetical protein
MPAMSNDRRLVERQSSSSSAPESAEDDADELSKSSPKGLEEPRSLRDVLVETTERTTESTKSLHSIIASENGIDSSKNLAQVPAAEKVPTMPTFGTIPRQSQPGGNRRPTQLTNSVRVQHTVLKTPNSSSPFTNPVLERHVSQSPWEDPGTVYRLSTVSSDEKLPDENRSESSSTPDSAKDDAGEVSEDSQEELRDNTDKLSKGSLEDLEEVQLLHDVLVESLERITEVWLTREALEAKRQ